MTRRNRKKEENIQDVNKLMQEIEDTMHVDNMLAMWNAYKLHIIGSIAGLFIAVTAWQWYSSAYETGLKNQSNALWALQQDVDTKPEKYNQLVEEGSEGYSSYAAFNKAQSYLQQNKHQEALNMYNGMAASSEEFADLAQLNKASILLDKDILKGQEILNDLIKSESPFMLSVKELLAISFEKQGKAETALKLYENLAVNPMLPNGMKMRVQARIDAINRAS